MKDYCHIEKNYIINAKEFFPILTHEMNVKNPHYTENHAWNPYSVYGVIFQDSFLLNERTDFLVPFYNDHTPLSELIEDILSFDGISSKDGSNIYFDFFNFTDPIDTKEESF